MCARLLGLLLLHDKLQEALHALLLLLHTLEPHVALCVHLLQVADPAQHTRLEVDQPVLRAAHNSIQMVLLIHQEDAELFYAVLQLMQRLLVLGRGAAAAGAAVAAAAASSASTFTSAAATATASTLLALGQEVPAQRVQVLRQPHDQRLCVTHPPAQAEEQLHLRVGHVGVGLAAPVVRNDTN